MEAAEKKSGVKIDGHIVLLNTGFHNRWYPKREMCFQNPGLTWAATTWLADQGLEAYTRMNDRYLRLIARYKQRGHARPLRKL